MNMQSLQDPRATDLLTRVGEDVSLLRQDIGNLLRHTTRHTLPDRARDLADSARHRLAVGRELTSGQIDALRGKIQQPATAWVGGAVLVGLLAAGVYWFLKSDCCAYGRPGEDEP